MRGSWRVGEGRDSDWWELSWGLDLLGLGFIKLLILC